MKKRNLSRIFTLLTVFLVIGQSIFPSVEVLADEIQSAREEIVNKEKTTEESTEQSSALTEEVTDQNPPLKEQEGESNENEANQTNAPPIPHTHSLPLSDLTDITQQPTNGGVTTSGEQIVYHNVGNVSPMGRAVGNGTTYLGKNYGGYITSTAYITIGGEAGWCIEPHKPAPVNIQYAQEIYNNEGIQNILYYAKEWGWTQANSNYVDVYVALNVYLGAPNFADHPAKLADPNVARLLEKARIKDAPTGKFSFNKLAQNAAIRNGQQETDWYTPSTDGKNVNYNITVPENVKAVTSDGRTLSKGVHALAQNISFKLVAPLNYGGTVTFDVPTNQRAFSALKFNPHDGLSQKLTKGGYANDPLKVKNLSATFVKRSGNVKVRKIDDKTGTPLANATFNFTYDGKNVEKVTDGNGEFVINDIIADTKVTVTEIKAPNNYVINKTPQTFTVVAGQTTTLTFDNTKQVGTARLFKEDSKTGANAFGPMYSLDGAIYGLYQVNGTLIKEVTLKNINGRVQAEVPGLALGEYYWQEIKAPNGYLIDKNKLNFSLTYAGQEHATTLTEVVAKDVAQLGKATVIKEDSETGSTPQGEASFENAVYGLFQADGTKIKSVTLKNVNGKVLAEVADLKLGDYYWQEEKAPEGYQLNTKKVPFSLTYAGDSVTTALITTVATDDVMKGGFDLFKFGNYDWKTTAWNWLTGKDTSSEQKQGLEGVEFTVYQNFALKKEVARKVTPKSGYLAFTGLPYGMYRVSETVTPKGYKTIADFYVTISEHGQTFHYSIENKVKEAQVKVVKMDSESGKSIPRAEAGFEVYSDITGEQLKMNDLTGKEQSIFFTNDKGELQIPTMFAYGNYRLKEVQAPKGYVLAKEEVKFSVTGDEKDGIVIIKFKNDNQKGQIKLHKKVQTATSLVTETTKYGELTKIDYTQQSGEGFKFKIKTKKDVITPEGTEKQKAESFVQSGGSDLVLVTDKDGNVESLPILYIGSYELVEVEAPKGVVMLKEPQPFEIEYGGQAIDVTSTTVSVDNDIQTIDIVGYKSQEVVTDWENGQAIIDLEKATNGQVFALKNAEDQMIGKETLAANTKLGYAKVEEGELLFKDYHLPEGKYYLEEIDAGEQHVLNPEKYEFEYVAEDNLDSQTIHVWADSTAVNKQGLTRIARTPIINELARVAVQLVKTDALDGKELENVLFDLVRIDGEGDEQTETIISKHATDAEGKILVENLPTGRYKLVETRPLDWYEDNKDKLDFTVTPENDGEIIELEAVNHRKPLEIETLFATTKDGNKQINPDIDHDLTDYGKVKGMKKDHTYYVDTFYMSATGEISKSEFEITGDGEAIQKFKTDLHLPKGTMKDGEILAAKHIIYSDKEKENEVGRHNEDLTDPNQMVEVKKPKVAIKTKAHTGDGKTQTFTHGDIIKAYDNVELTHKDVLDGTKRSLKAILVAVIPGKGEKDIWESAKIDYVVKDADIVKQVMTEVDTSKYPEGTTFYFKEIGYNEAGEEDTRHNFNGKDRDQSLTPKKVLPQTGEQTAYMFMLAGLVMVTMVVFSYRFKKEQDI